MTNVKTISDPPAAALTALIIRLIIHSYLLSGSHSNTSEPFQTKCGSLMNSYSSLPSSGHNRPSNEENGKMGPETSGSGEPKHSCLEEQDWNFIVGQEPKQTPAVLCYAYWYKSQVYQIDWIWMLLCFPIKQNLKDRSQVGKLTKLCTNHKRVKANWSFGV